MSTFFPDGQDDSIHVISKLIKILLGLKSFPNLKPIIYGSYMHGLSFVSGTAKADFNIFVEIGEHFLKSALY